MSKTDLFLHIILSLLSSVAIKELSVLFYDEWFIAVDSGFTATVQGIN